MRKQLVTAAVVAALAGFGGNAMADENTNVGGKMYFDFSNISADVNGNNTDATGFGVDVKRFYLSVDHKFDDVFSANITTDFNYQSNDGRTQVFVKKAYFQAKLTDDVAVRAGSADMPWIPYVEHLYGYRYVENTITDKLHFANSADWGMHLVGGDKNGLNYQVSLVNGNGYKNPSRSKGMDIEGRLGFAPMDGMQIALGAYSGKRGQDFETRSAANTASRGDLLVAYAKDGIRVGGEYFTAKDWDTTQAASDKADGFSIWGSMPVSETSNVFARFDTAKPSKDLLPDYKDKYFNIGLELNPRKNVNVAFVYKREKKDNFNALGDSFKSDEIGIFTQVKF
ncbi:MAG: porin [Gammaproteobacteria bacterium]